MEKLRDMIPRNLLTEEQIEEATNLASKSQVMAVKYIASIINEGLITAKTYFELYIG